MIDHEMTCSAATREKLRQAALRQWAEPQVRQRMQEAHQSPETRERHRQAALRNPGFRNHAVFGKPHPETRERMRQTALERWERLRTQGISVGHYRTPCIDCGKLSQGVRCRACSTKFHRGCNHPSWKGIRINFQGYADIRGDNRRLPIHRLIWLQANGTIPEGHVVHHINGNRTDNRLENLALMTQAEHTRFHRNLTLASQEVR